MAELTATREPEAAEASIEASPQPAIAVEPIRRRPRLTSWRSIVGFGLAWAILGAVWEVGASSGILNRSILPPPSEFIPYLISGPGAAGIGTNDVSFAQAIADTVMRVSVGFGLGVAAALVVGTLLAATPAARLIGMPIAQTIAPIAPVAWIPLAIALIGTGSGAAVFVVFMGIFATMTLATIAALASVPAEFVKGARVLGSRGWRLWLRVILPAASPGLAAAVRISFFAAWMAVLAGEMAGINSGLGALVILGQQQFNMRLVMAGLVTIGLLGFLFDRLLLLLRHRALWWEVRSQGGAASNA